MVSSSLKLLSLDYAFVQDHLLLPEDFVKEAKNRGFDVELDTLDARHTNGLRTPLFRVGHPEAEVLVTELPDGHGNNTSRDLVFDAALQGLLHDPLEEGRVSPVSAFNWNGSDRDDWTVYLYSSWQLLDLDDLRPVLDRVGSTAEPDVKYLNWYRTTSEAQVQRCRMRTMALAALSIRYLWRVTGRIGLPPGADRARMAESFKVDPQVLLTQVDYDPGDLQTDAIGLLMGPTAHNDPCRGLLPILRHMDFDSWMKLRRAGLAAIWSRIGAEVLLRCHADLKEAGVVEALTVDLDRERLSRAAAPDLDEALTSFDLWPSPMVLVLAEGETEMKHYPELLKLAGVDRSQYTHLMLAGTMANPELLARFAVAPRIGIEVDTGWLLRRRPTVLYIIMDPENDWSPAELPKNLDKLKKKIRKEVSEQNSAQIDDATLDYIVRAKTWLDLTGEYLTYELANFSADELINAMRQLAKASQKYGELDDPEWEVQVRADIAKTISHARANQPAKIGGILKKLGIDKTDLADALLPVLSEKYESEVASGNLTTPVVKVIEEVREIVLRSRKSIMLPKVAETTAAGGE